MSVNETLPRSFGSGIHSLFSIEQSEKLLLKELLLVKPSCQLMLKHEIYTIDRNSYNFRRSSWMFSFENVLQYHWLSHQESLQWIIQI